jgi:hypothetical protein
MSFRCIVLGAFLIGCGPARHGSSVDASPTSCTGSDCAAHCGGELGPCDDAAVDAFVEPMLCMPGGVNSEPEIIAGYAPASGASVGANGQIKVWVNDENAPIVAPHEQVDTTTGLITVPGDRTAKAPDNYLWEPAVYIAPQTAETGGTPHFPQAMKGDFNTNPFGIGFPTHVAGMDPAPPGSMLGEFWTAEFIWDVNALALTPGTYLAEFVIHDGDSDRGVGCVMIDITP